MNLTATKKQTATGVDIDSLLQVSYLLVIELRQGGSAQNSQVLWKFCSKQIEHVSQQLKRAGLSQRSINYISHAQCALLDETVLSCAKGDAHAAWASEPLQAKFFGGHQAGEFLYEDMREVLREPAPDLQVLTAFHRVLMLGFRGRYANVNDPAREQLLAALSAQVEPLELSQTLTTQVDARHRATPLRWLQSPLAHILAVGLLLIGAWWGLDHVLAGLIATLLPGQS
ncbi:type VI secretion system protein ImpK [Pseudomonas sp. GGS8]|uniref:type VI secretion system protein TssL, short form n=1 Tax=Pseudomonas sp. GGS8 TaxID=2817892 RepID=UPI00209F9400|nr:type VI secretion system protein TssL, short form [Pseudomonas sp. GGS8]MCP1446067.1 type VI secretion system protein ImpK [Pseudomonas sp. GGS8]